MNVFRFSSLSVLASLLLGMTCGFPALSLPATPSASGVSSPSQPATSSASGVSDPSQAPAQGAVSALPFRPLSLRLDSLMRFPGPIRLERVQSEATVAVPVSKRMAIRSATLRLRGSHSAVLLKHRSQLSVILNDQVVAQLPLDGATPTLDHAIPLPVDRLKADFNRLTFRVVQHYAASGLESPFAPELWTQIDTARSTVDIEATDKPLAPRLSDLAEIFSPKDHGNRKVALLSASSILLDENALQAGSIISQALALRLRYKPLAIAAGKPRQLSATADATPSFPLDLTGWRQQDAVLFGTREQVSPFLPSALVGRITGPFLGIYPQPLDPTRVLLIVSGEDDEDLLRAATALAFDNVSLPAAAEAVVQHVEVPEWREGLAQKALVPGRRYSFKELGFTNRTLNGFHREEAEITFFLPADFHVKEQDKATLSLHYALGAGLEPGSLINVLVNREFATTLRVENSRAKVIEGEHHLLPMRLFRPGENTLTLSPRFIPGQANAVTSPGDGMLMSLLHDSSLELPNMPRFAELPNLKLLALTGHPHTDKPDGSESRLWVTGDDADTLSAAYTLIGRLAQTTSMPLFRLHVSFDPKQPTEDLLVVSARTSLPPELLAPVASDALSRLERALESRAPMLRELLARLSPRETSDDLMAPLGARILAAQFESPFRPNRTVTLWTAESPALLRAGMDDLVKPGPWNNLQGAWTRWDPRSAKSAWQAPSKTYDRGRISLPTALSRQASRYPLPFIAFVFGLAMLLTMLTRAVIKRSHRKEPPGEFAERLF